MKECILLDTNQTACEFGSFCITNNRTPNKRSKNAEERDLAKRVEDFRKENQFTPEQLVNVLLFEFVYSTRCSNMTTFERLLVFKTFCVAYDRLPNQNSENKLELKIYNNCYRRKHYVKSPELLKEYEEFVEEFSNFKSSTELLAELEEFVYKHKRTPKVDNTNSEEDKLAKAIKSRKSRGKFTKEQLERIEFIYSHYGSNSGTSYREQLIFRFIKSSIVNNYSVISRDRNKFGKEVDVLIEIDNKIIAIFYDGYFHKFPDSLDRDNRFSEELSEKGIIVIRFREELLPELNKYVNCTYVTVNKFKDESEFFNFMISYFYKESPIKDFLSKSEIKFEELSEKAKHESTNVKNVNDHIIAFMTDLLYTENKLDKSFESYNRCRDDITQKRFTRKQYLLYACAKRIFDCSPRNYTSPDKDCVTSDEINLICTFAKFLLETSSNDKDKFIKRLFQMLEETLL